MSNDATCEHSFDLLCLLLKECSIFFFLETINIEILTIQVRHLATEVIEQNVGSINSHSRQLSF